MSDARWCDYGNHAFKVDDKTITMSKPPKQVTIKDQFGAHVGVVPGENVEICGECAVLLGLSNDIEPELPAERHAAIESKVKGK